MSSGRSVTLLVTPAWKKSVSPAPGPPPIVPGTNVEPVRAGPGVGCHVGAPSRRPFRNSIYPFNGRTEHNSGIEPHAQRLPPPHDQRRQSRLPRDRGHRLSQERRHAGEGGADDEPRQHTHDAALRPPARGDEHRVSCGRASESRSDDRPFFGVFGRISAALPCYFSSFRWYVATNSLRRRCAAPSGSTYTRARLLPYSETTRTHPFLSML